MTEYVVGFLFNRSRTHVILIEKKRPSWQRGKLNGVGGKIESGETPHHAMKREFKEETGMCIRRKKWNRMVVLVGADWKVHFFWAIGKLTNARTVTDERISICNTKLLPENVIPELRWLIPLCLDKGFCGSISIFTGGKE